MATPKKVGHEAIRALVVEHAGGYYRNIVWDHRTCDYCAGITSQGYSDCPACGRYKTRDDLSDRRGFLGYATSTGQSGMIMRRYKDQVPPPGALRAVTLVTVYGLLRHLQCATHPVHGPVDAWATIPSLSGRTGKHPFESIVEPLFARGTMPRTELTPRPGATKARQVTDAFIAPGEVAGRHVLLLDDTWASGGNAESAALALKSAGARCITTLVTARWLEKSWASTTDFVSSIIGTDYNPDICPFSGALC